jgi:hypothetical protein
MANPYDQDRKPTVKKPTAAEFKKGPRVRLTRPGWTNYDWAPHGFVYPIKFNQDDQAEVVKAHYDLWIGDDLARKEGIVVTPIPTRKPKPKATKEA